ncbi:hypothetical protein Are01nite_61580 [Actinoplanes regularis]|nr:hypothetical protein Are01nite_61580 [Actinoplanes regularis]
MTADGFKLGNWVGNQRSGRRRGQLSADRAAQVEKVPGWVWDARS